MWKFLGVLLLASGASSREVPNQMKIEGVQVQYSGPTLQQSPQFHVAQAQEGVGVYAQPPTPQGEYRQIQLQQGVPQIEAGAQLRQYHPQQSQPQPHPQGSGQVRVQPAIQLPVPESGQTLRQQVEGLGGRVVSVRVGQPTHPQQVEGQSLGERVVGVTVGHPQQLESHTGRVVVHPQQVEGQLHGGRVVGVSVGHPQQVEGHAPGRVVGYSQQIEGHPHIGRVVGVSGSQPYSGPPTSHAGIYSQIQLLQPQHHPSYSAVPYAEAGPYPGQGPPVPYPGAVPVQGHRFGGGIYAVGPSEEIVEDGPPPPPRPLSGGVYSGNPFALNFGGEGVGGHLISHGPGPLPAYISQNTKAYRYNQPIATLGQAGPGPQGEVRSNAVVGVTKGVPLPAVGRSVAPKGHESLAQIIASTSNRHNQASEYESSPIVVGKGQSPGPQYVVRTQAPHPGSQGPPPGHLGPPQGHPRPPQGHPGPPPEEYQESPQSQPQPQPYSSSGPVRVTYSVGGRGPPPPRHLTYSPVSGPPPGQIAYSPESGPPQLRPSTRHSEPGPRPELQVSPSGQPPHPHQRPQQLFGVYHADAGPPSGPPGLPPTRLSEAPPPFESQGSQPSHRGQPVTYSFPGLPPPPQSRHQEESQLEASNRYRPRRNPRYNYRNGFSFYEY